MSDALDIPDFELVPGGALRVHDQLWWARREFVIRAITPGADGVAWLALAEIRPGFIKEQAMVLPVILGCGDYRRIRR